MFDKTKLNLMHLADEPWVPAAKLGLPPGIEYRIFRADPDAGELDMMVRYVDDYFEPRHTHDAEHWQVILEGEMHVDGQVMKRGDYIFGPSGTPHGPFRFPKGMLSFVSTRGGSILHLYDAEKIAQEKLDAQDG